MAKASVQAAFNEPAGMLSPHLNAPLPAPVWMRASTQALQRARGLTQFFDRDTPSAFSAPAMRELQRFVEAPQLMSDVLRQLETLRQRHYPQAEPSKGPPPLVPQRHP
jgi:multiple sugar transport system substrate-binding protein